MSTQSNNTTHLFFAAKDREEVIDLILTEAVRKIDNSAIPIRNADNNTLSLIANSKVDILQKSAVHYLSGIIATSAMTAETSSTEIKLVNHVIDLTESDLLLHQVIYSRAASLNATQPALRRDLDTTTHGIAIAFDTLLAQLNLKDVQSSYAVEVIAESLKKLQEKGLVDRTSVGDTEVLKDLTPEASQPGIAVEINNSGFELFSWSHGKGHF